MSRYLLPLLIAVAAHGETVVLLPQAPLDPAATTVLEIAHGEETTRREITLVAQELEVAVSGPVPWKLRCADRSLWCTDLLLTGEGRDPVPFPIFRKARLAGRLERTSGAPATDRLSVQGWVRYSERFPPLLFTTDVMVEGGAFAGEVPHGALDLRIATAGGAPRYFWGVQADDHGRIDLGRLTIIPGSSLSGFLVSPESRPLSAGSVEIEPLWAGVGADLSQGISKLRLRAAVAPTGFFQFLGIEPGRYRLKATGDGTRGELRAVEVRPDEELHLARVLVEPLLSARVRVVPPQPVEGGRWTVILLSGARQVVAEEASTAGQAELGGLAAGDYEIAVVAPGGARLVQEPFSLDGDRVLELRLDFVEVRGRITLGGEPLAAQAIVETGRGDSVGFESDREGLFAGWLPALERRFLRVRVVAPDLGLERAFELAGPRVDLVDDVLTLELALPATRLHGKLVDSLARPLPAATVRAWDGWLPVAEAVTDHEGRFALDGLDHGRYWLTAQHPEGGAADPIRVELSENEPEVEAHLAARELRDIRGSLIDPRGLPVRGAQIVVASVGTSFEDFVTTDTVGHFAAKVVAGTSSVSVVVLAPSRSLWATCLTLVEDHLVVELPEGAPGSIEIATRGDLTLPPAKGSIVLVSDSGGSVSGDVRAMWSGSAAIEVSPSGVETESVAAVSPGWWAATLVDEPGWKHATERCSGQVEEGIELQPLLPGSKLVLDLDLRPRQRRRQQG